MTPTSYEIYVRGVLSPECSDAVSKLGAVTRPPQTVLTGKVRDQSTLNCVLMRLQGLGLEVVELRTAVTPPETPKRPTRAG